MDDCGSNCGTFLSEVSDSFNKLNKFSRVRWGPVVRPGQVLHLKIGIIGINSQNVGEGRLISIGVSNKTTSLIDTTDGYRWKTGLMIL